MPADATARVENVHINSLETAQSASATIYEEDAQDTTYGQRRILGHPVRLF